MNWFVIHAEPGAEKDARDDLTAAGFDAFLPLYWRYRTKQGKQISSYAALYPGYLFVREVPAWGRIMDGKGVIRLLMAGDVPGLVPDDLVTDLDRSMRMGGGAIAIDWQPERRQWQKGDRLRITAGPWTGLFATFERYHTKGKTIRVKCALDFLGGRRTISILESYVAPLYAVSAAPEPGIAVRAAALISPPPSGSIRLTYQNTRCNFGLHCERGR